MGRRSAEGGRERSAVVREFLERAWSESGLSPHTLEAYGTDLTLFEGVRLLPPGSTLTIGLVADSQPEIRRYWDYPFNGEPEPLSPEEGAERLHHLFVQAVTRQLVSDVPVGSYLSGGMDSGSISAVAGRHLPRLTTFTGGFDLTSASGLELGFDERRSAETTSGSSRRSVIGSPRNR